MGINHCIRTIPQFSISSSPGLFPVSSNSTLENDLSDALHTMQYVHSTVAAYVQYVRHLIGPTHKAKNPISCSLRVRGVTHGQ